MISATGEYALRAAVFLAQRHPAQLTTVQIAEATHVPSGYLSKVLQAMARADLVQSQRGLHGGFILLRPPDAISVLDVLRAVDAAPHRITRCPLGLAGHGSLCPVHLLVDEAVAVAHQAFASISLSQLCVCPGGDPPRCDCSG